MASPLSVGDILMLGSLAWKIGCAFTAGRSGAPSEFREVENELLSLQISLSSLSDTLDQEDSILAPADVRTKEGLGSIVSSCRVTLENLETLVNQYQDLSKTDGIYPVAAHRRWKASVVRNYKKLLWTSEGGNIQALRNMLHMHVGSIEVMIKALQSQSLARLENTVHPMAKKVDGIHDALVGNIDIKIAEIHDLMKAMTTPIASPSLNPTSRRDTLISLTDTLVAEPSSRSPISIDVIQGGSKPTVDASSNGPSSSNTIVDGKTWAMQAEPGIGKISNTSSPKSNRSPSITPYETPPTVFADSNSTVDHPDSSHMLEETRKIPTLSLPQPAVATSEVHRDLILPSATIVMPQQPATKEPDILPESGDPTVDHDHLSRAVTVSQHEAFEHAVSDHAITLCTRTGVSVDYIQRTQSEENSSEMDTKLIQAMNGCKISIVTKMRTSSAGKARHITSIWALSTDRKVRLQQQLTESDVEIVPYTVWGKTNSVVLRIPAELTYHDIAIDDKPLGTTKTRWVNYHFQDEKGSKAFQSALMWKRLLHSFCTQRTMLSHDGFVSSTFSFQQQLCGLENLRLWRDEEASSTIAMLHYSPHIHDGYLSFRVNGPGTTAKIVDEGDKWVKIKRLSIMLEPKITSASPSPKSPSPDGSGKRRKTEGKKIPAIRIEFSSSDEKHTFLEVCSKSSAEW